MDTCVDVTLMFSVRIDWIESFFQSPSTPHSRKAEFCLQGILQSVGKPDVWARPSHELLDSKATSWTTLRVETVKVDAHKDCQLEMVDTKSWKDRKETMDNIWTLSRVAAVDLARRWLVMASVQRIKMCEMVASQLLVQSWCSNLGLEFCGVLSGGCPDYPRSVHRMCLPHGLIIPFIEQQKLWFVIFEFQLAIMAIIISNQF